MADLIKALFEKFRQFITYGFVGIINTLLDFGVFTISHSFLLLTPEYSQAAGYVAGTICSFILNRSFTFRDSSGNIFAQIVKFLTVNGFSLLTSMWIMRFVTELGISAYIAKIGVTGIVMLINYFGYKLLVFNLGKRKENEQ